MLTEGLTGYHGSFGHFIFDLNNPLESFNIGWAMTQWSTFETIHTIAWCVILNGIIQGLLSVKGWWKKPKRQMLVYITLIIIVLTSTKFVWEGIYNSLKGDNGIGFPWGSYADGSVMHWPDLRTAGIGAVLVGIFVNPLAAPMEPIFPYLAVSFMGSIIGIAISQPKKALFKGFTKTVLLTGLVMFITGAIGTVIELVNVMNNIGFEGGVTFYRFISFHRHWFPDAFDTSTAALYPYSPYISSFAWLYQTFITNGFSIMVCMIVIFLVEFRGRGSPFAKKTSYIRRYGVIVFSNYNNQWIYFIPILILGKVGLSNMLWGETFLAMLITFALFTIVLYAWGLVNYRFSFEWFMKSIGYIILPIRRISILKEKKWYQKGDTNMEGSFYKADWINIVEENETYHKGKIDSKISMILSICSLAIPIFFAFSVVTLPMSLRARKKEAINKKNTVSLVLSIIGVIITMAFFVFAFVATPAKLGFYL